MTEEKKIKLKRLESSKVLGKFMADYYYELDNAAKTGEQKSPGAPVWGRPRFFGPWGSWSIFPKPIRPCWDRRAWPRS